MVREFRPLEEEIIISLNIIHDIRMYATMNFKPLTPSTNTTTARINF